jgi:membrane protease YdiL (CAAX protease family)
VLLLPIGAALVHAPTQARLRTATDEMAYLMPQGRMEALLFAGVAVTAGICEELIFRGFLFRYLQAEPFGFSTILSLIISTLFFGFGHAGQGPKGILVTGASGLFFAWLYLASGSLLLPIVLHIIVDLRVVAIAYITRNFSARLPL